MLLKTYSFGDARHVADSHCISFGSIPARSPSPIITSETGDVTLLLIGILFLNEIFLILHLEDNLYQVQMNF